MSARKVAVIGAGLGGLAAAVRLRTLGYDVEVYDRRAIVGGKAGVTRIGEYRFDTGPSLLTMPFVLRRLFRDAGTEVADYLRLIPLDEITRYFFADGSRLRSFSDAGRFGSELTRVSNDGPEQLIRYLDYSRRIYETSAHIFLENSLHEVATYRSRRALAAVAQLGRIDPFRSLHAANASFFSDPRLVQLFDRYATYNGSNPYRAPATLNVIPHVELSLGSAAVDGGIHEIPASLARLATALGAGLHLGSAVERILYDRRRRVCGIVVDGQELSYDAVVSNGDVVSTYEQLLDDPEAPAARRYRRLEPSSSGVVFFFCMGDSFPELGLHNIFFSLDYRQEFDTIFMDQRCPSDPTVYVNITSKTNPEDAAAGGENWFVLVNAPPNQGQDWPAEVRQLRDSVFRRVEAALGRNVRDAVTAEAVMTPEDIEAQTGSRFGSLYGTSSNSRLAAFLRHPNRSRRYSGLYFCGGGAHPGGGIPLVLRSGRIAAELLARYEQ